MRFAAWRLLAIALAVGIAGCADLGSRVRQPEMVVIPSGSLELRDGRSVALKSFELAKFDVTRGEFALFAKETGFSAIGCTTFNSVGDFESLPDADWQHPGFAQTDRDPVVCVNYDEMMRYVRWLSAKTGKSYRLPSETELRFASRAGQAGNFLWDEEKGQCASANGADQTYNGIFPNDTYFNDQCADGYVFTSPVGSFKPNGFGVYDAVGNVFQRVSDCFIDDAALPLDGAPNKQFAMIGGQIIIDNTGKVIRQQAPDPDACAGQVILGGSWAWAPFVLAFDSVRTADPEERSAEIGFRLARSLPDR